MIGHRRYESTAMEAREPPTPKPITEPKEKRRRGRPRKGAERPPEPETVLEKQTPQTLEPMSAEIPKAGDVGCEKNSQGYQATWVGYQLTSVPRMAMCRWRPCSVPPRPLTAQWPGP